MARACSASEGGTTSRISTKKRPLRPAVLLLSAPSIRHFRPDASSSDIEGSGDKTDVLAKLGARIFF